MSSVIGHKAIPNVPRGPLCYFSKTVINEFINAKYFNDLIA